VEEIYRLNGTAFTDIERSIRARAVRRHTRPARTTPAGAAPGRSARAGEGTKTETAPQGAIDTQAALLRLARSRDGMLRLVTTNFDRVFHTAAKRTGQEFQCYAAPMLPIPKNSRWNGLVYLHGLLDNKSDDTALNRLVVTSGDFGLAYLTERWAARFLGSYSATTWSASWVTALMTRCCATWTRWLPTECWGKHTAGLGVRRLRAGAG
jgi:hypothetical protein